MKTASSQCPLVFTYNVLKGHQCMGNFVTKWLRCIPFWVTLTLTLTSDIISRFLCLEHISYITNDFPQMCLMLDQFLLGHSSCYCYMSYLFIFQSFWISLHQILKVLMSERDDSTDMEIEIGRCPFIPNQG